MRYIKIHFVVLAILIATTTAVWAAQLGVGVNQATLLEIEGATRVAIANPEIADVVILSHNEVMVIGKKSGATSLHIWQGNGTRSSYDIAVNAYDAAISEDVNAVARGDGKIQVSRVGETVVLEGRVRDQLVKERAEKMAEAYGTKVVNLLEIETPIQVKLEAVILEITADKAKSLGISYMNGWPGEDGGAPTLGTEGVFGAGQSYVNTQNGNRKLGWFGSYADINVQVNALIKNGDAKILSQPSLVTMSGKKANILIGGQIPVPTSTDSGNVTVEWRDYGIKLDIEPQVDSQGLIMSTVKTEVSSLDFSSASAVNAGNGLVIPPLKSRKAETVIALHSGSTIAIGGLISSDESKRLSKIPILGDLPILGKFFQSTSKSNARTEIIILITPTLATEELPKMSNAMKQWKAEGERLLDDEAGQKKGDTVPERGDAS